MFAYQFKQRTKRDIYGSIERSTHNRAMEADLDCRIWLVKNADMAITRSATIWLIDTVVRIADHFAQFVLEYFKDGSRRRSRDYCRAFPGAPLLSFSIPFFLIPCVIGLSKYEIKLPAKSLEDLSDDEEGLLRIDYSTRCSPCLLATNVYSVLPDDHPLLRGQADFNITCGCGIDRDDDGDDDDDDDYDEDEDDECV